MPWGESWTQPYRDVGRSLRLYWRAYGGGASLVRSPYLHVAALLVLVTAPLWTGSVEPPWYDLTLAVVPSLLGFTLGGYAILLAFGDESFRQALSGPEPDGGASPFLVVNATFIHFILVQAVALLTALVFKTWEIRTGLLAMGGCIVFVYAILTAVAAAFAVLNLANWFDKSKAGK